MTLIWIQYGNGILVIFPKLKTLIGILLIYIYIKILMYGLTNTILIYNFWHLFLLCISSLSSLFWSMNSIYSMEFYSISQQLSGSYLFFFFSVYFFKLQNVCVCVCVCVCYSKRIMLWNSINAIKSELGIIRSNKSLAVKVIIKVI